MEKSLEEWKQEVFERAWEESRNWRWQPAIVSIDYIEQTKEFMEKWRNRENTDSPIYQGLSDSPAN